MNAARAPTGALGNRARLARPPARALAYERPSSDLQMEGNDACRSADRRVRARRMKRILFVTSNGTGLGHLTRSMAVARRLAPRSSAA